MYSFVLSLNFMFRSRFCRILLGLIIYEVGSYLNVFHGISPIVCGMIGCFFIICNFFKIQKRNISNLGCDYTILIVLTLLMFLRGSLIGNYLPVYGTNVFDTSLYAIFRHCFFDNYCIAYLIPLAAIINPNKIEFSFSKKIGNLLCIISIMLAIVHLPTLIVASSYVDRTLNIGDKQFNIRALTNAIFIGSGFFIFFSFCFQLIRGKMKWLFPITMIIVFLCTVAGAGRGDSLILILQILIFFYICFKYPYISKNVSKGSTLKLLIVLLFVIFGLVYLVLKTDYFTFLLNRLFEDGNTGSFAKSGREEFMQDMLNDFDWNPFFWLFGKGINGAYEACSDGGYMRDTIEWGFMQLILKGGVFYLVTYCFVLLRTAYLGILKSNNLVCKSFGFMCLIRVVELITFGHPSISVEFFFVWLGVGFVRNRFFRIMNNDSIIQMFKI